MIMISEDELGFELYLRSKLVEAAQELNQSLAEFASFEHSRCNPEFWIRTLNGGFQQRSGIPSSIAIRDIYNNGSLYAFECATAMVIVLYKAVLDTLGEEVFLRHFSSILLRDWHFDGGLRIITWGNVRKSFPGDILYFRNPDYDPKTPEWQGENAVKLQHDLYYGHGIGILNSRKMIEALNGFRKPNANHPAYLEDQVTFPDYKYLAQLQSGRGGASERYEDQFKPTHIIAKIGSAIYIRTISHELV